MGHIHGLPKTIALAAMLCYYRLSESLSLGLLRQQQKIYWVRKCLSE